MARAAAENATSTGPSAVSAPVSRTASSRARLATRSSMASPRPRSVRAAARRYTRSRPIVSGSTTHPATGRRDPEPDHIVAIAIDRADARRPRSDRTPRARCCVPPNTTATRRRRPPAGFGHSGHSGQEPSRDQSSGPDPTAGTTRAEWPVCPLNTPSTRSQLRCIPTRWPSPPAAATGRRRARSTHRSSSPRPMSAPHDPSRPSGTAATATRPGLRWRTAIGALEGGRALTFASGHGGGVRGLGAAAAGAAPSCCRTNCYLGVSAGRRRAGRARMACHVRRVDVGRHHRRAGRRRRRRHGVARVARPIRPSRSRTCRRIGAALAERRDVGGRQHVRHAAAAASAGARCRRRAALGDQVHRRTLRCPARRA